MVMQNTESQKYRCSKCEAESGEPCRAADGRIAEKVHYGRSSWVDKRLIEARAKAEETLRTSLLRPTATSTGIWIGSVFVSRDESVPYGAWYCPCGESREVLSLTGVVEMNERYAEHAPCRI
jgi:hypothetical protein